MINNDEKIQLILDKIKDKRMLLGYSMDSMALDMGLSSASYYKVENNITRLTVERLIQIKEILDLNINELFEEDNGNKFNQNINDNAQGYQNIDKFYSSNQKLIEENKKTYQIVIKKLESEVDFLREQLKLCINKK